MPIPTQDHSHLPAGAEVRSDSPWIQFNAIGGPAIGNAMVAASAISAIDVWGPLGVDAEVCFADSGSLLLLDAAYSPRLLVPLESYRRSDGKTCARLDRAGALALMPGSPTHSIAPSAAATPPSVTRVVWNPFLIADSLDTRRTLEDFTVRADELLKFRDRPAGRVPRLYIGQTRAIARTDNWFQVEYQGRIGWISSHFVTTVGECG